MATGRRHMLGQQKPARHLDVNMSVPDQLTNSPTMLSEKVIVIGDMGVGKTCLVRRYVTDEWSDGYKATIGVDFLLQNYVMNGVHFTLHIWDTAGQEQFRAVSNAYYRGAKGAVVCFDLGSEQSLLNTEKWVGELRKEIGDGCVIYLVGCKSDMVHVVDFSQGHSMAQKFHAQYFEASAQLGDNVESVFDEMARRLFVSAVDTYSTGSNKQENNVSIGVPGVARKGEKSEGARGQGGATEKPKGCACQ